MTPRNPKLEQTKPRLRPPAATAPKKKGGFGPKDLPRKVAQHKMKPGITSPQ